MNRLLSILTISTFLFFIGCQKNIDTNFSDAPSFREFKAKPTVGLTPISMSTLQCMGDRSIPLFAGQNEAAGMISLSVNSEGILTLCASSTCDLSAQHIFVGAETDLQGFKNGNLAPGKFAASDDGSNNLWTFDVSQFDTGNQVCFVVAYHAVGCEETIWAGVNEKDSKGNWSSYNNVCFISTTQ